jgi:glycosyltransferase involved in cell wall biosynthesis
MKIKVAIMHDWLDTYAGSEKVLEELVNLFPDADLHAVVDFLPPTKRGFIKDKPVTTTFIQRLPFARKKFRSYLPLMPLAIEQLDFSQYDVVISSSHAVAKGIITGPDQVHISYIHSPIRYAWDMQHQYLREAGLEKGLKGWIAKWMLAKMRMWDFRTANGVDYFISNSQFIAKRIWKVYHREAQVIYPPVDINGFTMKQEKEEFYFTASRLVPYKKMDLIVEAFAQMPDKKLIVIGDGSEMNKVKSKASSNVSILGYQAFEVLKDHMQRAKAFVFAAEEDFGITPVEAQACGTPVIAFGKGGALETVRGLDQHNPTGVFFQEQTVESIIEAVTEFEGNAYRFTPENCRLNAERFSNERFRNEIHSKVEEIIRERNAQSADNLSTDNRNRVFLAR